MNEIRKYFNIVKIAIHEFLLDLKKIFNKDLYKKRNIVKANIDIGIHHLHLGNINDAIFRFYLVTRFFDKENKDAFYLLAWSYFLKRDIKKAMSEIENCKENDIVGLKQYMLNYKSYDSIPYDILNQYKDFTFKYIYGRYFSKTISLSRSLVDDLLEHIKILPKDFKILDLGCKSGLIGAELDYIIKKNYTIHGVESNNAFCKQAENISNENKVKIYDDIFESEIDSYLDKANLQYDCIISFDSFNYTKNIKDSFVKVKNILKKSGCFIILLKKSNITQISDDLVSFEYQEEYIISQLSLAEFSLHKTKTYKINKNEEYIILIAS